MRDILYYVFGVIVIVLVVVMMILTRIPGFEWVGSIPFIFMGIFWVYVIITMKRDEKKEKEYCEANISQLVLQDAFFGDVTFDWDKKINRLTCEKFNASFGKYNPKIILESYEENNQEFYFRKLEYLYGLQQEIVETMMRGCLEAYSDRAELTKDRLEETFSIERIFIQKCDEDDCRYMFMDEYILEGDSFECEPGDWLICVESIIDKNKIFRNYYGQGVIVYLNCKTNEICYVLS